MMVLSPRTNSLVVLLVSLLVQTTSAFSALAKTTATAARLTGDDSASSSLTGGIRRPLLSSRLEAVKFDKSTERWVTDDPDEEAGSSYGPIGSLYRAGPRPFLSRIFDADTYECVWKRYRPLVGGPRSTRFSYIRYNCFRIHTVRRS